MASWQTYNAVLARKWSQSHSSPQHDKSDKRRLALAAHNGVCTVVADVTITSCGKNSRLLIVANCAKNKTYQVAEVRYKRKVAHYNKMADKLVGRQLEIVASILMANPALLRVRSSIAGQPNRRLQ